MTSRYLFPNLKRPSDTLRLLIVLALATVTLYWPATHHDFLVIDDWEYVVDNGHVNKGMSWEAARWAFTSYEASNWHPLTWLSHQADWSCYGPFAGGHHLTNLLLHTLNTLLLFLLLRRQTGNTSASWIVAALFGWHPLHVESVAWIAERKDLLSTLCLIGTLWAYTNYAQTRQSQADNPTDGGRARIWRWYGAALLVFAAGLMCKPMLVTLPCLLLLFDYWPLKRGADPLTGKSARDWVGLVAEKLAFFALSAAACMVTVAAQGQAIKDTAEVPFSLRLLNMLGSYGEYLRQVIWPYPLCIYYPLPNDLPVAQASTAALLLAAISWATVRYRRDCPWLLVGWLWLLGSLVPVIGLVQVGTQAHADRYMYIPSIGIFVAVVWTGQHLARHWRRRGRDRPRPGRVRADIVPRYLTHNQLRRWGNDIELMAYTLAHTQNNVVSQNNLGVALAIAGKPEEAIAHYRESLRIDPKGILARLNLGVQLRETLVNWRRRRGIFPCCSNNPRTAKYCSTIWERCVWNRASTRNHWRSSGRPSAQTRSIPKPITMQVSPSRRSAMWARRSPTTTRPCASIPVRWTRSTG